MAKRVSSLPLFLILFRNISGMTGRDIIGAGVAVYGSRTSVIIYNTIEKNLEEWTLRVIDENGEDKIFWERTLDKIHVNK
jgi:hypothetical protein